jgi:hypothetical protein
MITSPPQTGDIIKYSMNHDEAKHAVILVLEPVNHINFLCCVIDSNYFELGVQEWALTSADLLYSCEALA